MFFDWHLFTPKELKVVTSGLAFIQKHRILEPFYFIERRKNTIQEIGGNRSY
jgi:hypothetical protein